MHLKKIISLWALLALIFGQITLAHHSASHIDHGFSQEISITHDVGDNHHHHKDNKKHKCPECLLTKSLQTVFYNAPITLFFSSKIENIAPVKQSLIVYGFYYNPNSPRAPPAILI